MKAVVYSSDAWAKTARRYLKRSRSSTISARSKNSIIGFLITDRMVQEAEDYADGKGAVLIGFFHSHPDWPARPSDFDRDHALPWWSYVIVSVQQGKAAEVLSWELRDDRSAFDEERVTKLLS